MFRSVLDGLADLQVEVLLTVGPGPDPGASGALPVNALVEPSFARIADDGGQMLWLATLATWVWQIQRCLGRDPYRAEPVLGTFSKSGSRRVWAAALALMAVLVSGAAQPTAAAVAVWQPVGGGTVTVNTHVVGDVETLEVDGGLRVRGWIVDAFSATRPDQLTLDDLAGRRLGQVSSGGFVRRRDVADRFGSSAYSLSGFELLVADPPTTLLVNAHLGQLGWWQTTVATGATRSARVTRLACTSDDAAEVEVTSAEPFPVRNALTELHAGAVSSSLSRYADDGDTHTLIFSLTREQLLAISPDDTAFVTYDPSNGRDVWLIGPIDPTSAADCTAAEQANMPFH